MYFCVSFGLAQETGTRYLGECLALCRSCALNLFLGQGTVWRRRFYLPISLSVLFLTFRVSSALIPFLFAVLCLYYVFFSLVYVFYGYFPSSDFRFTGRWLQSDMAPCRLLCRYQRFGGTSCLCRVEESSDKLVFVCRTIWRHILQDSNLVLFLSLVFFLFVVASFVCSFLFLFFSPSYTSFVPFIFFLSVSILHILTFAFPVCFCFLRSLFIYLYLRL